MMRQQYVTAFQCPRETAQKFRIKKFPYDIPEILFRHILQTTKQVLASIINIQVSVKVQNILISKYIGRELTYLMCQDQILEKYFKFNEIKNKIKGVVIERVEKDYLFGVTFHKQWKVVERYVTVKRKIKQRNIINQYYFSNQPPKISILTQPTIASLYTIKGGQTNSTLELKTLTKNIDLMLTKKPSGKNSHSIDKKGKTEKQQKSKKKLEIFEETYGLRSYKKNGKSKSKARGSLSRVNHCITPQPHIYQTVEYLGVSTVHNQARLSQRKSRKSKSNVKRNSIQSERRKG